MYIHIQSYILVHVWYIAKYITICIIICSGFLWSTFIILQGAPVMEYAQVDKSKKTSQEKQRAAMEYDDTMVEHKVTKVSV